MEFGRVIDHHEFRHAITFPGVLDRRELAADIGLGQDRVFKASHHGQATRRFEASVEAHGTTSVLIQGRGDGRTTER